MPSLHRHSLHAVTETRQWPDRLACVSEKLPEQLAEKRFKDLKLGFAHFWYQREIIAHDKRLSLSPPRRRSSRAIRRISLTLHSRALALGKPARRCEVLHSRFQWRVRVVADNQLAESLQQ